MTESSFFKTKNIKRLFLLDKKREIFSPLLKILRAIKKKLIQISDLPGYLKEYAYYRFFYRKPQLEPTLYPKCFFVNSSIVDGTFSKIYKDTFPQFYRSRITEADLICNHVFDILGSGTVHVSKRGESYQLINWHCDFKSDYQWDSKLFFKNIEFGKIEGVDVKVPWELSRFQHLIRLGQAYVLSENEVYRTEFMNQTSDWIEHNRIGFGVNWKCPMDASIRAVNWLVAIDFFSFKQPLPPDFLSLILTSLYEHGKFIRTHLEKFKLFSNNHYIADLAGLFFLSVYCPFFKESAEWNTFSKKELEIEIEKQIYSDGCNFEASTSYHCLVLEMLFYSELIAKRAGIIFTKSFTEKVLEMFRALALFIKPSGQIPQLGDNDSGKFLSFGRSESLDKRYLLSLAAIHYEESNLKMFSSIILEEESLWVFGKAPLRSWGGVPRIKNGLPSHSFPNAGWFVLRQDDNYCFISCGPNGLNGVGGHAHNDKLSFELTLNGCDLIVDSGSYVYTASPEQRNQFRSVQSHSTIQIGSYEQNLFYSNLFSLGNDLIIEKAESIVGADEIKFEGIIKDYRGNRISREIRLSRTNASIRVIDRILTKIDTRDVCRTFLIFDEDVIFKNGFIVKAADEFLLECRGVSNMNVKTTKLSKQYGIKSLATKLELVWQKESLEFDITKVEKK